MGLCKGLGSKFKYGQICFQSEWGELKACLQLSSLLVGSFVFLGGIWCFLVSVCCHSTLSVFCLYLWLFGQACYPVYIISTLSVFCLYLWLFGQACYPVYIISTLSVFCLYLWLFGQACYPVYIISTLSVFCLYLWLFGQACYPVYIIIIYFYMATIKDPSNPV